MGHQAKLHNIFIITKQISIKIFPHLYRGDDNLIYIPNLFCCLNLLTVQVTRTLINFPTKGNKIHTYNKYNTNLEKLNPFTYLYIMETIIITLIILLIIFFIPFTLGTYLLKHHPNSKITDWFRRHIITDQDLDP